MVDAVALLLVLPPVDEVADVDDEVVVEFIGFPVFEGLLLVLDGRFTVVGLCVEDGLLVDNGLLVEEGLAVDEFAVDDVDEVVVSTVVIDTVGEWLIV